MIRGKIFLVPFPFDDLSTAKVRPAVCLSEPIGTYRHVVLGFISSQIPTQLLESDVVLDSGKADFSQTGLSVPSVIRLHRLMTITTRLVQRELGELPSRIQSEVANKLRRLFALE